MSQPWLFAVFLLTATAAPGTAWAVASAELYRTQPYAYGRFEARLRFAPGDGVVSSFFLWKNGSEMAGVYWNELDFEKVGADCHLQTNALHGSPVGGHEQSHALPSDLCGTYHDYAFEWTPTYIAWAIDGQEIRRDTGETAAAFAQNASAGMTFRFNVWPGNASFGGNFDPAILPVHQYISSVQYSAYIDGAFEVGWREEFDGPTLPSGWATGNWASPYNLSTHTARNVNFVDGIVVLSLTPDDATGFTGVPPADTGGSGGTAGSGGSAGSGATAGSGASAGSGGSGGATAPGGSGGDATSAAQTTSDGSDEACGCRVPGSRERGLTVAIAGLLALAIVRRRRRRS
jgi:endo-1,3-1,4-beta-glycanase ExoK